MCTFEALEISNNNDNVVLSFAETFKIRTFYLTLRIITFKGGLSLKYNNNKFIYAS